MRVGEVHALAERVARDRCLGRCDAESPAWTSASASSAHPARKRSYTHAFARVIRQLNYIYDSVVSKFVLPYNPVAPRGGNRKRCLDLPQSHLQTRGISNALRQVSENMGFGCGRTLISVYTGMLWTQLSTSFRGKSGIDADDGLIES